MRYERHTMSNAENSHAHFFTLKQNFIGVLKNSPHISGSKYVKRTIFSFCYIWWGSIMAAFTTEVTTLRDYRYTLLYFVCKFLYMRSLSTNLQSEPNNVVMADITMSVKKPVLYSCENNIKASSWKFLFQNLLAKCSNCLHNEWWLAQCLSYLHCK